MTGNTRQWWFVAFVVAVLAALVATGWTVRERFMPVEVGTRAPEFAATDMEGRPVSLSDLSGSVILLNIWATWCLPCREEMPSMQSLHERFADDGLRVVAVSIDTESGGRFRPTTERGAVAEFVDEYALTFDIWRDPEGAIQRIYRSTGVPETFVIDRDGWIVRKVIGATDWDSEANRDLIRMLLEN